MNLRHMNSIGSTTRNNIDESQPRNQEALKQKRMQFKKTYTHRPNEPTQKSLNKNFQRFGSLVSQNSDAQNYATTPKRKFQSNFVGQHFQSNEGKSRVSNEEGSALQMSQGNFSHAYTNIMKENFKSEDFDSY